MLAKLRARKVISEDGKELRDNVQKSINVHEEYHRAFRTKSYADFFTKAQLLVNQPSIYSNHIKFSETLLEPDQETIPSIVDSASILSQKPQLKNLILTYFDITASASHICSHLLKSINLVHSNYQFIQKALDIMDDDVPPRNLELIIVDQLNSFIISENPFSNPNKHDFNIIHHKNSLILQHLKAMRKKVARKIKYRKYIKKAIGVCVTLACGVVAIAATIIAAHTLTALIMGPAIFSFPIRRIKRKLRSYRLVRSRFLCTVRDQLDVAAKGTYILSRDFDTMSRLVARLHDEIEHNRAMIRFWLDRKEDNLCLQIVKELKKSDVGFRKQVEELEEHVYLCLVTINRARALVIKEMTSSCVED